MKKREHKNRMLVHTACVLVAIASTNFFPGFSKGASYFWSFVAITLGGASLVLVRTKLYGETEDGSDIVFWDAPKKLPEGFNVLLSHLALLVGIPFMIFTKEVGIPFISPAWWIQHWFFGLMILVPFAWTVCVSFSIQFLGNNPKGVMSSAAKIAAWKEEQSQGEKDLRKDIKGLKAELKDTKLENTSHVKKLEKLQEEVESLRAHLDFQEGDEQIFFKPGRDGAKAKA